MEALTGALETAFTAVKTDALGVIGVALPVALSIVAAIMAIKIGIKFFKNVSGN